MCYFGMAALELVVEVGTIGFLEQKILGGNSRLTNPEKFSEMLVLILPQKEHSLLVG